MALIVVYVTYGLLRDAIDIWETGDFTPCINLQFPYFKNLTGKFVASFYRIVLSKNKYHILRVLLWFVISKCEVNM